MLRLIAPLFALLAFAAPLHAACQGQDLRPTLSPDQRAELADMLDTRPFTTGNHWTAEKDGEVLHLIGTVHLDDPRLAGPIARLIPVVESASMVLLEMTAKERNQLTSSMATDPGLIVLKDTTLPELMSEDDWQLLSKAMSARGIPPFMAAKFQPWYISMLLGMPPCLAQELAEQNGLDARIEAAADAANIPTRALEPFDVALKVFGDTPIEDQITLMRSALADPEGSADLFETLMAAYVDQHHAESWLVTTLLSPIEANQSPEDAAAATAAFEHSLLINRNKNWIPVLEQALSETEGPVVAGFGAAHLSGEFGVLNLLAKKGYHMTRQPF